MRSFSNKSTFIIQCLCDGRSRRGASALRGGDEIGGGGGGAGGEVMV